MKILAATAFALGLGVAAAQAMPASPLKDSVAPEVQTVGWRCGGPGWHMNPWGRCVPNRRFYGGPRFYGGYGWGHRGWHRGWHRRHW
jgi:hypothetical protein